MAAVRVHGAAVVAALTAQNSAGVTGLRPVSRAFLRGQLEAAASELRIAAVKTGVLAESGLVAEAAAFLEEASIPRVVVDPVLHASSGAPLLSRRGLSALKRVLLPLAAVVTPNIMEAEKLAGCPIRNTAEMRRAAEKILRLGCKGVVVKGGHLAGGKAADLFFDGARFRLYEAPRLTGSERRGAGCTFSAAIAAYLALGLPAEQAVLRAKELILRAFAAPRLPGKKGGLDPFIPGEKRGLRVTVRII
jgi:hydroxymethylpyrimidine/phosphomethylpyrimidine kinase